MTAATAYFYTTNGRITGTRSGDRNNLLAGLQFTDKSAIIVDGAQTTDVEKLFINSRGELDTKTPLTTLKYPNIVDVGNEIVITGLPELTTVYWPDSTQSVVNDGTATWTATTAAKYPFTIDHAHYIKRDFVIETNPSGDSFVDENLLGVQPNDIAAINVPANGEVLAYKDEEFEWITATALIAMTQLRPEMLAATNAPEPGFTLAYDSPGLFRWVDPDPPDLLNMKPFTDADLNLITKE